MPTTDDITTAKHIINITIAKLDVLSKNLIIKEKAASKIKIFLKKYR